MSTTDTLKKTTIDRIKLAAPLTVAMSVPVIERIVVGKSVPILSLEWFYSMLSFFILSTIVVAALMYNYKLLSHSCAKCLSRWSAIQSGTISVSSSILKFNFIKRYFLFKIEKKFKTYSCRVCQNVQHRKSTNLTFIGTSAKQ